MALTKVPDVCPLCKKEIAPGRAIYITKVNLTDNGRSGPGEGGMAFGGSYKATPQGKLRIQHLGSSNPRVCVHEECYHEKIERILFPKSDSRKHVK